MMVSHLRSSSPVLQQQHAKHQPFAYLVGDDCCSKIYLCISTILKTNQINQSTTSFCERWSWYHGWSLFCGILSITTSLKEMLILVIKKRKSKKRWYEHESIKKICLQLLAWYDFLRLRWLFKFIWIVVNKRSQWNLDALFSGKGWTNLPLHFKISGFIWWCNAFPPLSGLRIKTLVWSFVSFPLLHIKTNECWVSFIWIYVDHYMTWPK